MLHMSDSRLACREHARLREDDLSEVDPSGSGSRSDIAEGGRNDWAISQGGCLGAYYSLVLISSIWRGHNVLLKAIWYSSLMPTMQVPSPGLQRPLKRVGRGERTERHDEGHIAVGIR